MTRPDLAVTATGTPRSHLDELVRMAAALGVPLGQVIELTAPPPPAVCLGWQAWPGGEPVTLWHLTAAIGPYPQGTTLRTETLRGCGSTILEPAPLEVHVCS